jgi:hypothetical protein
MAMGIKVSRTTLCFGHSAAPFGTRLRWPRTRGVLGRIAGSPQRLLSPASKLGTDMACRSKMLILLRPGCGLNSAVRRVSNRIRPLTCANRVGRAGLEPATGGL